MEPNMITVDLIIPSYERQAVLLMLLESIQQKELTFEDSIFFSILIVDQSKQPLSEINFNKYPLNYIHHPFPSLPNARNIAIKKSKADILVFIDDDVEFDEKFIFNHIKAYEDQQIGAVAGRVIEKGLRHGMINKTTKNMYGIKNNGLYYPIRGGNSTEYVLGFPGGNFSIKRELCAFVGDFDTRFRGSAQLEETDYAYRLRELGYKIKFLPEASLIHLRLPSGGCRVADIYEKRYWRYHNTSLFFLKHKKKYFLFMVLFLMFISVGESILNRNIRLLKMIMTFKGFLNGFRTYSAGCV